MLSIAGLLLVASVKTYQSLQSTFQLQAVKYNIDQLLEAASNYYKANCAAGDFSPNVPGFLSPYSTKGNVSYPPGSTSYYPVSISSTLLSQGYLQDWHPTNPNVDAMEGESGYVVQLNPMLSSTSGITLPVNTCVVTTTGQACLPITNANITAPSRAYSGAVNDTLSPYQAIVVTWQVQVAVKINPQSKVTADASFLGADCMSDSSGTGTVDPCSVGNSSHKYLVWSRIPSASLRQGSIFSASLPALKQFKEQYTQDPYYQYNGALNSTYQYNNSSTANQAPVYYLCGG